MNPVVSATVAKVEAFRDLRPRMFGMVLAAGAVLLIWSAFREGPHRDDERPS